MFSSGKRWFYFFKIVLGETLSRAIGGAEKSAF